MIKKLNKKIIFRFSLIISSLAAVFFAGTKDDSGLVQSLDTVLPSVSSILKIEKAYALSCGDCSGSSDGGITYPAPDPTGSTVTGGAIRFAVPPTNTYSCGSGSDSGAGCFVAGTQVALADGTHKSIEDITIEDVVATSSGDQSVMRTYHIPYAGLVYAFNGSEAYFVTPSHPFMTTAGWKSIDPTETAKETPDLAVEKLAVGDEIMKHDGTFFTITALEAKPVETTVYNLDVNGSHDYFADGFHVHNVSMKFIETAEARAVIGKN